MDHGDTIETNGWRIHLGALAIRVTHIVNAGKRGKKCAQFVLWHRDCFYTGQLDAALVAIRAEAERGAEPAAMRSTMEAHVAGTVSLQVSEERGIDVDCANDKIEILGACVAVRASSQAFFFQNRRDVYNLETMTHLNKRGAAKVLAWVKANKSALETMTFVEVAEALRLMGVRAHYYCAID